MCASLIVSSSSNSCDSFIFDGVTTISNTSDGFYLIINVSITVSDAIPIYPKCEHTQTLPLINFYRIYLCVCALLNWPNLMSRWLIVPMLNVRRWRSRCIQWKCVFGFSLCHGSSSHLEIASYGDTLENWVFYFQEFVLLSRMNDNGLGKQNRIHKTNREKK